mgnify:FL=1
MRSARVLFDDSTIAITDTQSSSSQSRDASRYANSISETDVYSIQHAGIGRKPSAGPQAKGYRNDGETYTLDSRGSSDAVCSPNAPFRVRESSRFSKELDSRRFRAVGNAVAVPIIEWIGKRITIVDQETKSS